MIMKVLAMVEEIVWMWGICQMEFTKKKMDWVKAAIIIVGAWIISSGISDYNIAFPVETIIKMIGIIFLFEGTLGKRLAQFWFSVFYLEMIYLPIRTGFFLMQLTFKDNGGYAWEKRITSILTILIVYIVGVQIRKRKQISNWIKKIPIRYYVLGIICSFSANVVAGITRAVAEEMYTGERILVEVFLSVVMLVFYIIGIGFAVINLWKEQYKRESALKDEYLEMSRRHYEELEAHMREVRSIRHDMHNHMFALENYIKEGKYPEAESYLQEIKVHQSWKSKPVVEVGNELVNAVLEDGIARAGENVSFSCEGMLPKELPISDFELCTIFSNLMSNSVEACKKILEGERKITLEIGSFQNKLMIFMENTVDHRVSIEELGSFTSKSDKKNHGYGIYNVKQVVEKYDGEITFLQDENKFKVKIFFYF